MKVGQADNGWWGDRRIETKDKVGTFQTPDAARKAAQQAAQGASGDAVILRTPDGQYDVFKIDEVRCMKAYLKTHTIEKMADPVYEFIFSTDQLDAKDNEIQKHVPGPAQNTVVDMRDRKRELEGLLRD